MRLDLNESRQGFFQRGGSRSYHVQGLEVEKAQEPTVECLVQGIRSTVHSMGGHVKLKTVTEIKWSSARDTLIAESVYLVVYQIPCGIGSQWRN